MPYAVVNILVLIALFWGQGKFSAYMRGRNKSRLYYIYMAPVYTLYCIMVVGVTLGALDNTDPRAAWPVLGLYAYGMLGYYIFVAFPAHIVARFKNGDYTRDILKAAGEKHPQNHDPDKQ